MRLLLVTCFLAALIQNTWAQTDSTTTANITVSASSTPSTSTVTPATGSSSTSTPATGSSSTSTPATGSSSTSTPATGSSSTSTASTTTNVTQSPAAPNVTNNETTAASPNTTDANATTTLPTTTTAVTTTAKPPVPFSDTAVFTLELTLGPSPNSTADIVYTNLNLTRGQLLASISQYFQQSVAIGLSERDESGNYSLKLNFFFRQIYGINSTLEEKIRNATIDLNNTETEFTVSSGTLKKISQFFQQTSDNPCLAENVCPLGSDCQVPVQGCVSRSSCGPDTCNGNGQCVDSVSFADKKTTTKCICDESYDTEYYGDQCESSRTGKLQIIAIIAGVLGAAILVLLVIIIIICVTQRRKGSGYEISKGHKNKAYDSELTS